MIKHTGDKQEMVSIIIPAYNAGKHISQMLDSILNQTYTNLEIIVAYDIKSTDNTLNILRKYNNILNICIDVAKDESSGQARNRGAKLATGEYILFLDADDIITPTYISDLMQGFIEYPKLNIVCGSHISSNEDEISNNYKLATQSKGRYKIYSQKTALKHLLYHDTFSTGPWTWLVKRKYIEENEIIFPNYSHGDDTVWIYNLILNDSMICHLNKIGYIFIQHPTSITNSISSPIEHWNKYNKYREDITILLSKYSQTTVKDFQNLEKRHFVRELTKLPYPEFTEKLLEENISLLVSARGDSIISRMSIICFNISKHCYWVILRLKHR